MNLAKKDKIHYLYRWLSNVINPKFFALKSDNLLPNTLAQRQGPGLLSLGWPGTSSKSETENRVFWFPNGLPSGQSVAVVSSRIGKRPEKKIRLFEAMRTVFCRLDVGSEFLISHDGISTDKYTKRAAKIFGLPLLNLLPMPMELDYDWFESTQEQTQAGFVGYYDAHQETFADLTIAHRLTILLADRVFALSVRKGGNLQAALTDRLLQKNKNNLTFCMADSEFSNKQTTQTLFELGAIQWQFQGVQNIQVAPDNGGRVLSLSQFCGNQRLDEFLIHWTRACNGPWPDQTGDAFVDSLLCGLAGSDHSKYSTLTRILVSDQLLASNRVTRDSVPVVCFSERTVDELIELKVFRPHLCRWDFEGVGIAIKRSALQQMGARKVIYGNDKKWKELAAADRPFFQIASSGKIDWTDEQEWRIQGNVNLRLVKINDAFVFVDSLDKAWQIAAVSKWPVVVINAAK